MSFKIIALDQGTTSSRALLINDKGHIEGITQKEFTQYFPKSGWVEHDPEEIWSSQHDVLVKLIRDYKVNAGSIAAIGITNQRETAIVWDRETGEPIHPAIVWQDKRTAPFCEELKERGLESTVKEKSGLIIDSYFSGTKVKWILDNVEGAMEKANAGKLAFGTVDSWLIWKLTNGKKHVTDTTNASRTMLFDIHNLQWDETLMNALGVPSSMMPEVLESSSIFGEWNYDGHSIPIASVLGDQQAALFGQNCFNPGEAKNTYGTGCFMLMNTGDQAPLSKSGLLTTVAWSIGGKTSYALEGSIFIAGAAVQWLRDALKVIDTAEDSEYFARKVPDTSDHVYVVPAFAGLGAPYWDMYARGAIFGLTRDTGKNQIIKGTLDSLAFQTRDVLQAMESDSGLKLDSLQVDGGAVANNYLMQLQSDILGVPVIRPEVTESTAMGAAYLAGITKSVWDERTVAENRKINMAFDPQMPESEREERYGEWQKAVERTLGWLK